MFIHFPNLLRTFTTFFLLPLSVLTMISATANAGFNFNGQNEQDSTIEKSLETPPPLSKKSRLQIYSNNPAYDASQTLDSIDSSPPPIYIEKATFPSRPSAPSKKHLNVETWKADQGESLKAVIHRWSERAETDLVWTMEDRRVLLESVSYFGDFEGALTHLFDIGMQGTVEGELSYTDNEDFLETPVEAIESVANFATVRSTSILPPTASSKTQPKTEQKWKATKGDSLKKTLTNWQSSGDYKLIWDYPFDVTLPNSVFAYGSVEDGLSILLNQFTQEAMHSNMRPVGDVYNDPISGDLYLHIKPNQ